MPLDQKTLAISMLEGDLEGTVNTEAGHGVPLVECLPSIQESPSFYSQPHINQVQWGMPVTRP